MIFNGAEGEMNGLKTSPGRYAGEDNGWSAALFSQALFDFDQSIMKYPSIQRFPGGASNDLIRICSILRTRCRFWIRPTCRRPSPAGATSRGSIMSPRAARKGRLFWGCNTI